MFGHRRADDEPGAFEAGVHHRVGRQEGVVVLVLHRLAHEHEAARLHGVAERLVEAGEHRHPRARLGGQEGLNDEAFLRRKAQSENELRERIAADPEKRAAFGGAWEKIASAQKVAAEILRPYNCLERGLAFDRRYLVVDENGTFVTQREQPRLCLVQTAFDAERLLVWTANRPTLELPKEVASPGALASCRKRKWRVWDDVGSALELGEGSKWFSDLLNADVSLLYMPDSERRAVNPKRARPGDVVSFADAYPLLLVSEASLTDLNQRLPAGTNPLEMRRFRPNLVISGCAAARAIDSRLRSEVVAIPWTRSLNSSLLLAQRSASSKEMSFCSNRLKID